MPDALASALEHLAAAVRQPISATAPARRREARQRAAARDERLWPALRSLGPAFAACPSALARLRPPVDVEAIWRRDLRATRARNVLLLAELERAFDALDAAGVHALAFKGAAALDRLYADPGARPMDDADLLVRPADRDRAADVLGRLGYERRPEEPGRFGAAPPGEWTFDGPVQIDLHWHLVADTRLRALFPGVEDPSLWARAVGRRLSSSDAALAAAVTQPLGHPWSHPLGYLDLRLELATGGADDLVERAAGRGLGAPTWWSLRFTERLFGGDDAPRALAPRPLSRRLGEMLVGADWVGLAPFRREMPARDLFVMLLAGPAALRRSLAAERPRDLRGTARAAISLARAAARALAN
jgi:hypothetical protein